MIKWLGKNSDYVVAHSKQTYTQMNFYNRTNPIIYFPHPISTSYCNSKNLPDNIEYDILIWGKMSKYKGILDYIKSLQDDDFLKKHRILLAGKFYDEEYYFELKSKTTKNITILNKHFSHDEIVKFHEKSRYILFIYNHKSVLNSGILADSLGYRHTGIIGPNKGAFKDLKEQNLIFTYDEFSDIKKIINNNKFKDFNQINNFCEAHSWDNFANKFQKLVLNDMTYSKT